MTFFKNHKALTVVAGAGVIVGGYFLTHALSGKAAETRYVVSDAALGTVSSTISGTGQIWGETQIEVSPEASGKVTKVYVKNGDSIQEGDVIMTLDAKDAQKTVRDAKLSLASAELSLEKAKKSATALSLLQATNAVSDAQRTLDDLTSPDSADVENAQAAVDAAERTVTKAETDLKNAQEDAENGVVETNGYAAVSSAFVKLPDIMQDVKDVLGTKTSGNENMSYYALVVGNSYTDRLAESAATATKTYDQAFEDYVVSNRDSDANTVRNLLDETLDATKALADALDDASAMFDAMNIEGYSDLAIADRIDTLIPKVTEDISSLKGETSSLQSSLDDLRGVTSAGPRELLDAQDALENAKADLVKKQTALDTLLHPSTADIAKAEESLSEKKVALADLTDGPDALDLKSAELSYEERRNSYADALENLEKYTVRAPVDGVVQGLTIKTGMTTGSGTVATVISPEQSAQISLNEVDIANVKVGNKATLTFDAIDGLTLTGHVVDVNGLGAVSQGVVSYTVTVVLDSTDERVLPGMSASVTVITDIRQDVLTVPASAVKTANGISTVQVFSPKIADGGASGTASSVKPQTKTVDVGLSSDAAVEITSGLSEGDQVVTRTITATTAKKTATTSSAPSIIGGGTGGGGGQFRTFTR